MSFYRHVETGKMHKVKFDLEWKATGPYFDFDTDMNVWVTCDTMATERWSKEWFAELKTLVDYSRVYNY